MEKSKQIDRFGTWPSQISAEWLGQRLRFEDVQWTPDGQALVWVEGRSGQGMLVQQPLGGIKQDLLDEQSARGGVLYGGGEFTLDREWVTYVDRGRQLFRRSLLEGVPQPLAPLFGSLAAPAVSPDGKWVVYVYSDGQQDLLALVDAAAEQWPRKLVQGADFYMQPAWSPDGGALAWMEWDHPNMPWDATRIMLARLAGEPPEVMEKFQVAGGEENVTQPCFSPDGRWLSTIASRGEWEALMLYDRISGEKRVLLEGDRLLLSTPAWVQGVRTIAWSCSGERIFAIQNYAGRASLLAIEINGGKVRSIDIAPCTWLKQISASPVSDELAVIASSPQIPERIMRWDGQRWHIVARADAQPLPASHFSMPEEVCWQSLDGSELHGFYFPPANLLYKGQGAPPMIVNIHGGPTHQIRLDFQREAPYFTSRGYAWLEVSYRGSIGLGRSYQDALNGRWGELDVEDVVSGAMEMVRRGLADSSRLVLFGGSAGGFTVLNALIRYPGRFRAGICLYPVTDLLDPGLVADKFESHFMDRAVGLLPQAEERYRQRSPLYHSDQIKDPVALFHGSLDTAVPVGQSQQIAATLRAQGVPVLFQIYEGEGHGFRQAENLANCYQQIERFLQEHLNRAE